jgi:hypothetical protein
MNKTILGSAAASPGWGNSWKPWFLFAGSFVGSAYIHEIGHCLLAWLQGCLAIPTPAKEYFLRPPPPGAQNLIALGGILGSVAVLLGAMCWLYFRPDSTRSALLAGAMTIPGFYTLRFLLAGRGHDATEFQDAQAAIGLSYSGHALDRVFLGLFVAAAVFWFWRIHPRISFRLFGRLILGAVVALVLVVVLQSANNAIFDPIFGR